MGRSDWGGRGAGLAMRCPGCDVAASVTNTFSTPAGTTRRGVCPQCGSTLTEVAVVAYVDPARGQGAAAVARQLIEGKASLELKKGDAPKDAPLP